MTYKMQHIDWKKRKKKKYIQMVWISPFTKTKRNETIKQRALAIQSQSERNRIHYQKHSLEILFQSLTKVVIAFK